MSVRIFAHFSLGFSIFSLLICSSFKILTLRLFFNFYQVFIFFLIYFLVLPVSFYQPISLHPRAHTISHVIPWTSVHQTPLSMDFSRQEYWSGLPFPSPWLWDFYQIYIERIFVSCLFAHLVVSFDEYNFLVFIEFIKGFFHLWLTFFVSSLQVKLWSCSVVSDSLQPHGL